MNKTNNKLAFLIGSLLASSAGAQDSDGLGVQVGPFRAVPTLGVTLEHDSNVLRSPSNELDSFVTVISPGVQLERGDESGGVVFGYEGEFGRYADFSSENYDDHRLYAQVRSSPSARLRLAGNAQYELGHDFRGESGAQQGGFVTGPNGSLLFTEPDEFRRTGLNGSMEYGAEGARALLAANAGVEDLEYRNNRQFTQFRDQQTTTFGVDFGWRVAPKTRLTLSADQNDIEFERQRPTTSGVLSFDNRERMYMLGVSFDPTSKTSGFAQFGRIEKDFDDPRIDDFSGSGWVLGMSFRPLTYSAIDVSTSRRTDEADDVFLGGSRGASFIVSRDFTIGWSHGWTDRFKTSLDVGQSRGSYRAIVDESLEVRNDQMRFWGLGLDYQFRPWLQIGAGYKAYERDSSDGLFDYDRDVLTLSFEGTL